MKPFGLAGKPRPEPCGCCWYTREDCPYVSAKSMLAAGSARQNASVSAAPL
ncbi:hypothetical protein ACLB1Q_34920 [Escherichia coli]